MRYELKSIPIWPVIKISFFFYLIIGFIIGLIYALFMGLFMAVASRFPMGDAYGPELSELSFGILIIVLPIFGAVGMCIVYTLLTVIMAFIYNVIARLTGGLEFKLEPVTESPPIVSPAGPVPPASAVQPSGAVQPPTGSVPPPPPPQRPPGEEGPSTQA
jgi:hypothetical protein